MTGPEVISDQELVNIRNLRVAIALATANAKAASAELRAAQLERQNFFQALFIQYGLLAGDQISEETGMIIRKNEVEPDPVEPPTNESSQEEKEEQYVDASE